MRLERYLYNLRTLHYVKRATYTEPNDFGFDFYDNSGLLILLDSREINHYDASISII